MSLWGTERLQKYCVELVAENASGPGYGEQVALTAGAPSAVTYEAQSVSPTAVTVIGEVDPTGQATKYDVAYGLAESKWCTSRGAEGSPEHVTTPETLGPTDAIFHEVTVKVSGLAAGTKYCAEMFAENGSGASQSEPEEVVSFLAGVPVLSKVAARVTGTTTAVVEGQVDPAEQETKYQVAYGLATSTWCTSEGSSGAPGATTPLQPLGVTDATSHPVSVALSELSPGTEYCAELLATNGSGLGRSYQEWFTTTPLYTATVSIAGTGSGTVTGSGISCPGTCVKSYVSGTRVAFTATAAPGSTFTGWSACPGTEACGGTMSTNRTIVATFTANPPPTPVGVISVDGSAVAVKSTGRTAVKLTCAGNTTCVGKLTLTARVTTKKGKKKLMRFETIGHASFAIAPGATATVTVKLTGAGRGQLGAEHGHLNATLAVVKTSPGPASATDRTVHLALEKAKKGGG
jgi:hypothetical protein